MATQFLLGIRLLAIKFVSYLVGLGPIVVTVGRIRYWVDPKTGRMFPAAAGADDGAADDDDGDDGDEGDAADDDDDKKDDEPDWKRESRKHERRAKAAQRKADDLQRQIDDLQKGGKKGDDDAIAKAKKEARDEALAEAAKERNQIRLEAEITRLAAKGVKVDDELTKFANPDDALAHIQRRVALGDIDAEELFDDKGKVQTEALSEALSDLLADAPHLKAGGAADGGDAGKQKPAGSSDAGKGKSAAAGQLKSTEGMTSDQIADAVAKGQLNDYLASTS